MVALVLVLASPVMAGDAVSVTDVPSAARDNPLTAWALDLLSETRDRPSFSLRRRPPPPPALPPPEFAAPAPETPPPTIVLLAIVIDDGVAHAVVRTAEHKAICARLGNEVAGWKVTHIEPRRLVLSFGDRAVSFAMFAGMNGGSSKSREPEPATPDVQMQNVAQRQMERRIGR
jgi:general secretion pathway protein N